MLGIEICKQHLGLQEVRDNSAVRQLLRSEAHAGDIAIDPAQIAWCAAWMNFCERSVGNPGTGKLNARSFLTYGQHVEQDDAKEGDIIVFDFERDGVHGHVTYFSSWDDADNLVACIGGNQHNCVCSANYIQDYIVDIRRF